MKNNTLKSNPKIHLWFGLSSGILVFIIAITGCLYAFQEEIQDYAERISICCKTGKKPFLFPTQLELPVKFQTKCYMQ
jgi:uncharacterized iron-regulated membrane protein